MEELGLKSIVKENKILKAIFIEVKLFTMTFQNIVKLYLIFICFPVFDLYCSNFPYIKLFHNDSKK